MAKREIQSGSKVNNRGGTTNRQPGGIDPEYVAYWDLRIREDLNTRIGKYDSQWAKNEDLIRNTGTGFREGNLAAEFIKTLHARLLTKDLDVHITPDDPEFADHGEKAEVTAQAVQRIADLRDALHDAVTSGTFASYGVLEVGHPLDPYSMDPYLSFKSPNVPTESPAMNDDWREVDAEEVNDFGGDVNEVTPFDDNYFLNRQSVEETTPLPIYSPAFGYPWVKSIDPRLVIFPLNSKNIRNTPYIARLRFITRSELKILRGYDEGPESVSGQYTSIFNATEGDGDSKNFPELMLIMELWIKRDRNNPYYNNWYICYIFGHPDKVIYSGPNPTGGMIPFIFVKLNRLKNMFDTTLAEELQKYTDLFDAAVLSMEDQLLRQLNRKYMVEENTAIDEQEEKKLFARNYRGPVKVKSIDGIQQFKEESFNEDLLRSATFIKGLAQSTTGQSELDRGRAIKEITARQTQALIDATGINVEEMADQISDAAAEAVMKLMHLTGIYSMAGRSRKFAYGGKFTSFSRGAHDFITSYIYDVKVRDNKEEFDVEGRMLWVQFLRTLIQDTQGVLLPYFDREGLAKSTVRIFEQPVHLLASRAAGREPQGYIPQKETEVEGGEINPMNGILDQIGSDMVEGQHPERETASRGLDIGNVIRGGFKTGTGTGEL